MADNKNAEQKKREAQSGMAAYEAERSALLQRTEKLRALRLAREAEEAANAPPPVEKPPKKAKTVKTTGAKVSGSTKVIKATKSKKKATGEPLSTWIKAQSESGRNN